METTNLHFISLESLISMNKPLIAWQKTLRSLGYEVNWQGHYSKRRRRIKKRHLHFDNLEPRKMLASASFADGHLEVIGTAGDDIIAITVSVSKQVRVLANNEEVDGFESAVFSSDVESIFVSGSDGNDQIDLSGIYADDFKNISSAFGTVRVEGGLGDDTIFGGDVDDLLLGGGGNDHLVGGGGNDTLVGGYGIVGDVNLNGQVDFFDHEPFTQAIANGVYQFEADINGDGMVSHLDDLFPFIDLVSVPGPVLGDSQDGNDILEGGAGDDKLQGGTGDDTYVFSGRLNLGVDTLSEFEGFGQATTGVDTLDFSGFGRAVTVDLTSSTESVVAGDLLSFIELDHQEIENIIGTQFDDDLTGNEFDNVLFGGMGNDNLVGGTGDDTLVGGVGDDDLVGGAGNDVLVGGDRIVGDVNLDGRVDFFDISPLISRLTSDVYQFEADVDGNGFVNFFDISPFISLLTNGQSPSTDDGNDTIEGGAGIDLPEVGFSIDDEVVVDTVNLSTTGLFNASGGSVDYGDDTGVQPISASSSEISHLYEVGGRYTINVSYQRNGDTYIADSEEVDVMSNDVSPVLITSSSRSGIEWVNFTIDPDYFVVERSSNGLDGWVTLNSNLSSSATSFNLDNSLFNQQTFYYRVTTVKGGETAESIDRVSFLLEDPIPVTATITGTSQAPAVTLEFYNEYFVQAVDPTYTVYRKLQSDDRFDSTPVATFQHSEFPDGWTDNDVESGEIYDYSIERVGQGFDGTAALSVAVDAGPERHESRGSIILVIDNRFEDSLRTELSTLTSDLIGDGYFVIHEFVDRETDFDQEEEAAEDIRDRIRELYNDSTAAGVPANRAVTSVLLIGDIPVPRSGFNEPGGHSVNSRAAAADLLYGDVDGVYTDVGHGILRPTRIEFGDPPANLPGGIYSNSPGDGRFDQQSLPDDGDGSPLELSVGRIDMSNLTLDNPDGLDPETLELELLRRYLNKDHDFRTGNVDVENAALINDRGPIDLNHSITDSRSSAYAVVGRDDTHSRLNTSGSSSNDWLGAINDSNFSANTERDSFLFGFAAGFGVQPQQPTDIQGVISSQALADGTNATVFNRFSSSFTNRYDDDNSLLRAVLADEGLGLTSIWSRQEDGFSFHGMGTGGTVGESFLTTVNQGSDLSGQGNDNVFTNLMGDPTLRAHVLDAPSGTTVNMSSEAGRVEVSWTASSEDTANGGVLDSGYEGEFLGYHVYRASSFDGEFVQVSDSNGNELFSGTEPVTLDGSPDDIWMVRAVKREITNSGTYINLSQGAFSEDYLLS